MESSNMMIIAGWSSRLRHMKEPPLLLNQLVLRQTKSPLDLHFGDFAQWVHNDTGVTTSGGPEGPVLSCRVSSCVLSLGKSRTPVWSFPMQREHPIAV